MKIIIKIYYSFKKYILIDFRDIEQFNEIFIMKYNTSEDKYYDDCIKYNFFTKEHVVFLNEKYNKILSINDFDYLYYRKIFKFVYSL